MHVLSCQLGRLSVRSHPFDNAGSVSSPWKLAVQEAIPANISAFCDLLGIVIGSSDEWACSKRAKAELNSISNYVLWECCICHLEPGMIVIEHGAVSGLVVEVLGTGAGI